jgi:2-methylisocitrate lyase-like PEP mutase family enzyme
MSDRHRRLESDVGRLRDLHRPGEPLLLVNVWDAETAKRAEAAGAPVVATSSAAIAGSLGGRDDNSAGPATFEWLAAIAEAVSVPVTADLEGGYGLSGSELVDRLLRAGAVGCNIEDTDHSRGDRLLDAEKHARYLAEIREAAQASGVPIVLNARIDTIVRSPERNPTLVVDETVRRARLYLEAGADCVYPIGLREPEVVRRIVDAVDGWVNVNPSAPLSALAKAGAARVSFGAGPFFWLMGDFQRRARAALDGDATAFNE